ncbi:hypothetical protein UFOVP555_28 [uncultured Caudovirales phage]|uniref:Uncharacterized protein n=1 Tax=uncultured Caudovirales phage TaxID=2100421 RepID=A0A6J5MTL9_9CAUD|nr:hypothetical protein UFOVP555_28 [uncultured Caudovirales phage]
MTNFLLGLGLGVVLGVVLSVYAIYAWLKTSPGAKP